MASVRKGDGKEEIMEPRSTSVWEVWKNFPIFSIFKSRTFLYINKIVTMMFFTIVSKSSSNERCQGGRVTLIVPSCHPGWEEMENLSGNLIGNHS